METAVLCIVSALLQLHKNGICEILFFDVLMPFGFCKLSAGETTCNLCGHLEPVRRPQHMLGYCSFGQNEFLHHTEHDLWQYVECSPSP